MHRSSAHVTRGASRSLRIAALVFTVCDSASAQNRGVYPLGMSATNSGATPAAGLTYTNLFILYARDESRGADGEVLATGGNSVLMDMNTFVWASRKPILGGARYAASATLPFANNSLASDATGAVSGGGGFADSYYQPLILGWEKTRVALKAIYGFLAPTGRFTAGATDNVGSGYWTNVVASGQSLYLTSDKRTAISAFEMYEVHGTQEGTDVRPGDTFNLDYSVTHTVGLTKEVDLQVGVVGYEQRQTSDKSGPAITPGQSSARYDINAIGLAANFNLPSRKASLGLKYFGEFANRSTFQGYALQISGSLTF
jgi:hypothetical protein